MLAWGVDRLGKFDQALQALQCGLLLWLPLLLLAAFAWSAFAPERLYHCWDDVPLLTCLPPFVHPEANTGALVDHYIWPAWAAYTLWFGIIALTFVLPALLGWLTFREWPFEKEGF